MYVCGGWTTPSAVILHTSFTIFFLTHTLSGPELAEKSGTAGPGALGIGLPVPASSAQEFQAHAIIFHVRIAGPDYLGHLP